MVLGKNRMVNVGKHFLYGLVSSFFGKAWEHIFLLKIQALSLIEFEKMLMEV